MGGGVSGPVDRDDLCVPGTPPGRPLLPRATPALASHGQYASNEPPGGARGGRCARCDELTAESCSCRRAAPRRPAVLAPALAARAANRCFLARSGGRCAAGASFFLSTGRCHLRAFAFRRPAPRRPATSCPAGRLVRRVLAVGGQRGGSAGQERSPGGRPGALNMLQGAPPNRGCSHPPRKPPFRLPRLYGR